MTQDRKALYKARKFDYLADIFYLVEKLKLSPDEKEKALSLAEQVAENTIQIYRILDAYMDRKETNHATQVGP